jgi:hypothetical protein
MDSMAHVDVCPVSLSNYRAKIISEKSFINRMFAPIFFIYLINNYRINNIRRIVGSHGCTSIAIFI